MSSESRSSHPDSYFPTVGGTPFPGYTLIRQRGTGGFATVWEAEAPGGRRIAMKFMASSQVSTTARELRSLQSIQKLDHPNLLKIHNVWSIPGTIVIGMDLADASMLDLFELYLSEFGKLLEPDTLIQYLYPAAQALDFLNARRHRLDGKTVGLQHGDIKPNNILLLGDEAQLADYGLATPTSGSNTPCPRHGTAEYCAPEVFSGYLSERSDQFSFAVTYFILRTARFPFPEPPPPGPKLKNYQRPEPDLSPIPVPGEQAALAKAMAPIPQMRFNSCCDFLNALLTSLGLHVQKRDDGRIRIVPGPPKESPSSSSRSVVIR